MTTLLIARHGNTFDKGDTILRVGLHTDLPLSKSGEAQAKRLGHYLKEHHPNLMMVYSSELQRTYQTATLALEAAESGLYVVKIPVLNEIDYGPDEGLPEDAVRARIGKDALQAWEEAAVPPPGWQVDSQHLIAQWKALADEVIQLYPKHTILMVTSNGIARFAPYLTGDFEQFRSQHEIKMAPGALSCFRYVDGVWRLDTWNHRP